ncbi:MAG: PilZ domain-containing protein [Desulfobacteraceae bacterium]|jgi:PilZ domain-containing protein|nr:PilZ domain-containing protein [Desulfobacteraceae bacterium]MDH3573259.1 PilZ domain-containing protein [Desulfobacteraceae bacterium]MDH3721439.1 PilZ domain-containing protein [Desulfobacteraceae bacterium]MDH3835341.1 PilZ domain-containing protein [Desulfobacteraceae bacterium]MDH3873669.1 PilZ domain-containing protein [Desulfobacteraceae bacterium]
MKTNSYNNNLIDRRPESRTILDRYYSVEFRLQDTGNVYQFKLRDMSSKGLGILVNKDSAVLKHLKVEDTVDMKYIPPESAGSSESLKTQIAHITQKDEDPFKGHFLIGLIITERENLDPLPSTPT